MPFITNELLSYYPLHTDYVNSSNLNVTDYQGGFHGRLVGYNFNHGELFIDKFSCFQWNISNTINCGSDLDEWSSINITDPKYLLDKYNDTDDGDSRCPGVCNTGTHNKNCTFNLNYTIPDQTLNANYSLSVKSQGWVPGFAGTLNRGINKGCLNGNKLLISHRWYTLTGFDYMTYNVSCYNYNTGERSIIFDPVAEGLSHSTCYTVISDDGVYWYNRTKPNVTNGKYNKGVPFDGLNDWITFENNTFLENSTAISFSAWVYPLTYEQQAIFSNYGGASDHIFDIYLHNSGQQVRFDVGNGTAIRSFYSDIAYTTNIWNHIAITYNATNTVFYLNGNIISTSYSSLDINWTKFPHGLDPWYIGSLRTDTFPFNGSIDEIRLWNKYLTQTEIQAEMNSPNPIMGKNLLLSYSFEKHNTTTVYDTNNVIAGNTVIYVNDTAMYFNGKSNYVEFNQTTFQSTNAYSFYFQAKTNNEASGSNNYAVLGHRFWIKLCSVKSR